MDTVTDSTMAISIGSHGAMGIVHRFMSIEEQSVHIKRIIEYNENVPTESDLVPVVPAIGVGNDEKDRFYTLYKEYGLNLTSVAIDVANGHSSYMREAIEWIKDITNGELHVIAGNVATGSGFAFLSESGADAVRVGIGGGSICKTRIMTGVGVPTLASVADAYSVKKGCKSYSDTAIIADGGIRYPADLVKSLAAGADAIIAGRIFAGTIESPGEIVSINGESMKTYRGMASKEVQDDKRGGLRPGTCAEGVSTYIPLKGKAYYIVDEFCGGLRSAMTYINANSIDELRNNALFMRLTASSLEESHAFGTRK
jgi:IMP dehydrogenase